MTDSPQKAPKRRPPNPKCENCAHPRSFHPYGEAGARPCGAFGCQCTDLVLPEEGAE